MFYTPNTHQLVRCYTLPWMLFRIHHVVLQVRKAFSFQWCKRYMFQNNRLEAVWGVFEKRRLLVVGLVWLQWKIKWIRRIGWTVFLTFFGCWWLTCGARTLENCWTHDFLKNLESVLCTPSILLFQWYLLEILNWFPLLREYYFQGVKIRGYWCDWIICCFFFHHSKC